jgi:hypothetical protein
MTQERLDITPGAALDILDRGEEMVEVWLAQGTSALVGLGRSRALALESARTTLQQALNVVDVAIERGPRT